jgi:hypothetical protein
MCDIKKAHDVPTVFVSAKTRTPVPVGHPALRDALIQATLDPIVQSIDYIASARVASAEVPLDAVIVEREDGRYALDVIPARCVQDIDDEGLMLIALGELELRPLVLTAEEIRREPRRGNANLIWSYNNLTVPIALRMRILQTLLDEGPIQLGQLLKSVGGEGDPAAAVMALACANLVCLDLIAEPLSPTTLVKYCR